jgi:hypothetical protein
MAQFSSDEFFTASRRVRVAFASGTHQRAPAALAAAYARRDLKLPKRRKYPSCCASQHSRFCQISSGCIPRFSIRLNIRPIGYRIELFARRIGIAYSRNLLQFDWR